MSMANWRIGKNLPLATVATPLSADQDRIIPLQGSRENIEALRSHPSPGQSRFYGAYLISPVAAQGIQDGSRVKHTQRLGWAVGNTGRIHIPAPAKSAFLKDKWDIFHSPFSLYLCRPKGMHPNPWRPARFTVLLLAGHLTGVAADAFLQIDHDAKLALLCSFFCHAFFTLQRKDLFPTAAHCGHSGEPGVNRLSAGPSA
jgi:hypothetical protein